MNEILIIRVVASILTIAGIAVLVKLINKMKNRAKEYDKDRLCGK